MSEDWPWHEPTVRAIVERLEASPHRVHQGAANIIAAEFHPDGATGKAYKLAVEKGWPKEAVLAGMKLAKEAGGPSRAEANPPRHSI